MKELQNETDGVRRNRNTLIVVQEIREMGY
jgi:hypothetical protein